MSEESWEDLASLPDHTPSGWRRHARAVHLDLVRRWGGPPRGRWLKTDLAEERAEDRALLPHFSGCWIGIDVAAGAGPAGVCEARVSGRVAAADVRCLPFASAAFDGVLSTSTLDHFHDRADLDRSVGEIRRVLRPGGVFLLTMDNGRNLALRTRNALPRRAQLATGLVPFPVGETVTAEQGEALLQSSGFEVAAVEHILHAPFLIGTRPARWRWWERRALPAFDRLGRTRLGRHTGHYVAFRAIAR